jgi:hypothetical protein
MAEDPYTSSIVAGTLDSLLKPIYELVEKLAGPAAGELGQMFADKVRAYRVRNWIAVQGRIKFMLSAAGLEPKAIPPRMLSPNRYLPESSTWTAPTPGVQHLD